MKNLIVLLLLCTCLCNVTAQEKNAKPAVLSGTIDCYKGKGHFLCVFDGPGGQMIFDTIKVNKDGSFIFKKDLKEPTIGGVYTEFLESYRGVYQVYLVNGAENKIKITTSPAEKGGIKTNVEFMGDHKAESEFLKIFNDMPFSDKVSSGVAAKGTFKEFETIVNGVVDDLRTLLSKSKDKEFIKKYSKELDIHHRSIPFRFAWGKKAINQRSDTDENFVSYVNSFDLNDISTTIMTDQIIRWKMDCNPTAEESNMRFMNLVNELVTNQEVKNRMAGELMENILNCGGVHNLKEMFARYKEISTDRKMLELLTPLYNNLTKLDKGVMSLDFDMQDVNGKTLRFHDVVGKGKVVYIDFWATWCGPCCQEIPFVEKLVEKYKGNNDIEFISISLDNDLEKWHNKLAKDKPQWKQYVIPDNYNSTFAREYNINAIPRFMVFDKEGRIIDIKAPRPSDSKIDEFLKSCLN